MEEWNKINDTVYFNTPTVEINLPSDYKNKFNDDTPCRVMRILKIFRHSKTLLICFYIFDTQSESTPYSMDQLNEMIGKLDMDKIVKTYKMKYFLIIVYYLKRNIEELFFVRILAHLVEGYFQHFVAVLQSYETFAFEPRKTCIFCSIVWNLSFCSALKYDTIKKHPFLLFFLGEIR